MNEYTIKVAQTEDDFLEAKKLFLEYAETLGFSLCFQGFDKELAQISTLYAVPTGVLLLLENTEGVAVGCVGVKKWQEEAGELKRLYIKSAEKGKGLGKWLMQAAFDEALKLGYKKLVLDTLPQMKEAVAMYEKYGFEKIKPYYENPIEGALYFEKKL